MLYVLTDNIYFITMMEASRERLKEVKKKYIGQYINKENYNEPE